MLTDKKFGLTANLLATKVMPSIIPHSVNPTLSVEQFETVMDVLTEMLDVIHFQRKSKMRLQSSEVATASSGVR